MTLNYEIRIGKSLRAAWLTFLKAPEVFIAVMLGQFALSFVLPRVPRVGFLLWMIVAALLVPSFVLLAEAVRREGRARFEHLRPLGARAPAFVLLFLVKYGLIGLGSALFLLPGAYLFVIYSFAEVVMVTEKKGFWASLDSSRQLTRGHWLEVFGLSFLALVIIFAGVMMLGVGMLVSVPLATLLIHAAYRDIREQVGIIPEVVHQPAGN